MARMTLRTSLAVTALNVVTVLTILAAPLSALAVESLNRADPPSIAIGAPAEVQPIPGADRTSVHPIRADDLGCFRCEDRWCDPDDPDEGEAEFCQHCISEYGGELQHQTEEGNGGGGTWEGAEHHTIWLCEGCHDRHWQCSGGELLQLALGLSPASELLADPDGVLARLVEELILVDRLRSFRRPDRSRCSRVLRMKLYVL